MYGSLKLGNCRLYLIKILTLQCQSQTFRILTPVPRGVGRIFIWGEGLISIYNKTHDRGGGRGGGGAIFEFPSWTKLMTRGEGQFPVSHKTRDRGGEGFFFVSNKIHDRKRGEGQFSTKWNNFFPFCGGVSAPLLSPHLSTPLPVPVNISLNFRHRFCCGVYWVGYRFDSNQLLL